MSEYNVMSNESIEETARIAADSPGWQKWHHTTILSLIATIRDRDKKLGSALDLKARCIMELSDVTRQRDELRQQNTAIREAITSALEDLHDIVNMKPELDLPSLQLYRVDGRDMHDVRTAHGKLSEALAKLSGGAE